MRWTNTRRDLYACGHVWTGGKKVLRSQRVRIWKVCQQKEKLCMCGWLNWEHFTASAINLIKCKELFYQLEITRNLSTPHLSVLLYYKVKLAIIQGWVSPWIPKLLNILDYLTPWGHMQGTWVQSLTISLRRDKQISSVIKDSYYQSRITAKINSFLSYHDSEKVI